jgi:polar amino acid transport system substrate-binding protein
VIDLNEALKGFTKFLLRLIREDIALKTVFEAEALSVLADRGQIEQVIMNLVTNARDAMPNGGKLVIETKRVTMNRDFIEVHGYGSEGEYALVSVSDTGIGMDEKTRSRIFEPFFTTKEQGKGTGLGLSMVYGTVKKHDGFINVYSEPGNGTTFKIYLPAVRAAERADYKKTREPIEPLGGMETILVAEDDASIRRLTLAALKQFGYTAIEALDGADAVSRFNENREKIQLVLLDGIMPRMNGKEAFREIKAINPHIKCIFMSGYAEDIFAKDSLPDGSEFILKPVSPFELLKKIREVLDK